MGSILINDIGKTFNHLTILSLDEEKKQEQINRGVKKIRPYFKCQCDCGNICSIRADHVKSGHATSCGCAKIKAAAEQGKKSLIDITGQKFGKLTVLKRDDSYQGEHVKWICQCECGNIISVFGNNLKRLHTTSCGCSARSIGEENIEKILKENNINYAKEYSFNDLKDKGRLRFDFAIFDSNNNLIELIEFDGRQHNNDYTPWNSEETLEQRQYRDILKDNYCKENNIKLIRIQSEQRDSITLKLLELGE